MVCLSIREAFGTHCEAESLIAIIKDRSNLAKHFDEFDALNGQAAEDLKQASSILLFHLQSLVNLGKNYAFWCKHAIQLVRSARWMRIMELMTSIIEHPSPEETTFAECQELARYLKNNLQDSDNNESISGVRRMLSLFNCAVADVEGKCKVGLR
ncbi:hypothetical protein BC835DRAFT_1414042 [Cytidiella melzeri]|nr:hypothetical protein BC835DRAFT_1414042 [Cytidiella melzeri]